jgi:hypothetical protein
MEEENLMVLGYSTASHTINKDIHCGIMKCSFECESISTGIPLDGIERMRGAPAKELTSVENTRHTTTKRKASAMPASM